MKPVVEQITEVYEEYLKTLKREDYVEIGVAYTLFSRIINHFDK